jgi:short-chain Z-isoprenyl diphosphate synthase
MNRLTTPNAQIPRDGANLCLWRAPGDRRRRRGVPHRHGRPGATLPETVARLTPTAVANHLYTAGLPDPDLIIRTSGEIRLSGFLLWQNAHGESYFTDVNWPAFRKIDFLRAIGAYQQRQRRFGL